MLGEDTMSAPPRASANHSRRTVTAALVLLLSAAWTWSVLSTPLAKLKLGLGISSEFLPIYVAKDNGFFEKHGLDLTLQMFPVPSNLGPALASGNIDLAIQSPVGLLQAREAGLDFVVVSGLTRLDKNNIVVSLLTRKGVTVRTPADLKGKKVGVPGINSGNYIQVAKWLLDGGVAVREVIFVEAPIPQMGDMLRSKTLDAVVTPDPMRARIVNNGIGDIAVSFPTPNSPNAVNLFVAALGPWAKQNRDEVLAFRAALADGIQFVHDHQDATRQIEKAHIGTAGGSWPTYDTTVDPNDLEFYAQIGKRLDLLHNDANVAAAIFR
jgi:NitT/TauT family transport system substrate-binding protein